MRRSIGFSCRLVCGVMNECRGRGGSGDEAHCNSKLESTSSSSSSSDDIALSSMSLESVDVGMCELIDGGGV